MRTIPLLAALAIITLTLPATAHVDNFSEAKSTEAGPYTIFLDPQPSPLFSGTTLTFSTIITEKRTGGFARDLDATLNVTNPDGVMRQTKLKPDSSNYHLGALLVDVAGNHTARITLTDKDGTYVATTWFDVYPDIPYRITPGNAALDAYAGESTKISLKVTKTQFNSNASDVTDLTVRMEHWSDDHKELIASQNVAAKKDSTGLWIAQYTFPERGMYHMTFASESGGFTYSDTPLLHMYATANPGGSTTEPKATPGMGILTLLGLTAIAAVTRQRK